MNDKDNNNKEGEKTIENNENIENKSNKNIILS